jgi:hypothetical protein
MGAICSCGRDHAMDDKMVASLDGYEKQVGDLVRQVKSEKGLADNHAHEQEVRISFLNSLAARIMAESATLVFERVEEDQPKLSSREQLSEAYSIATTDTIMRLQVLFRAYLDRGELPSAAAMKAELDREHTTVQ